MSPKQQLVSEIGEFGLIDQISADTIVDSSYVVKGIGDDCAVLRTADENFHQLLTTDMLIESIHFSQLISDADVGYKAITCNISDIAAMGGIPRNCLISLGVPGTIAVNRIERLYQGMKQACREYSVNIVGGDMVRSPQGIIINVAMTGAVSSTAVVYRSGAQSGDLVAVSGPLGLSAIGLQLLQKNISQTDDNTIYFAKHCRPQARVELGQQLAKYGATAMNDISDGLASELNEIAASSGVGILVDERAIPVAELSSAMAALLDKTALQYALYGGEDYELVFTIAPADYATLDSSTRAGLVVIGSVTEGCSGLWLRDGAGQPRKLESRGYNHFSD